MSLSYTPGMGRNRKRQPEPTGRDTVPGFGTMIRTAREAHGWTADRLATEAGISMNSVYMIEAEKRAPSLRVAAALVKALELVVYLHDPARPVILPARRKISE